MHVNNLTVSDKFMELYAMSYGAKKCFVPKPEPSAFLTKVTVCPIKTLV